MRTAAARPIEDCLLDLFRHLGIEQAHIAAGGPPPLRDWQNLATLHPERVGSLTLISPPNVDSAPLADLASRMLVFAGDQGRLARGAAELTASLSSVSAHILRGYEWQPWSDVIADRDAEIGAAVLDFPDRHPLPTVRLSAFRAFARLPLRWSPKKSVLHQTIAAIRAETWEAINQALLASAKQERLESGATVRLDSTVTSALMHEPSDSTLLSDAVRVMTRLLQRGDALPETLAVQWRDRRRLAKKRARAVEYSRGQDKKRQLYRELIAATEASRDELQTMAAGLTEAAAIATERWRAEVAHYLPLIARVIVQTRRRVLDGEIVPASEKLVSLFEPHADIIVKGSSGSVRTQAQPGDRQKRTDPRYRHRNWQSGRCRALCVDARSPYCPHRRTAAADRRRWWLRQPRQSRRRQGPRHC